MKITCIAVGKIKEKFYKDAIAEYEKRLGKYCRLQIVEVADEKVPAGASIAQEETVKAKEAERILAQIKNDTYVITLEIAGAKKDSAAFAKEIASLSLQGKSHITFIIGGSLGLHPAVCRRADAALSFSDMTFPHQLMRVILLEQIYRAYRIINGEPYHK